MIHFPIYSNKFWFFRWFLETMGVEPFICFNLENKLLLISINFTPKTSHSCLKKLYTRFSRNKILIPEFQLDIFPTPGGDFGPGPRSLRARARRLGAMTWRMKERGFLNCLFSLVYVYIVFPYIIIYIYIHIYIYVFSIFIYVSCIYIYRNIIYISTMWIPYINHIYIYGTPQDRKRQKMG